MVYYSTIHTAELIYFDYNTQETMKIQLYPPDSSKFPSLYWRISQIYLTVTQTSTCISYVNYAQKRRYTV